MDRAGLAEKSARKDKKNILLAKSNYRSHCYQTKGKYNTAEITNSQTIDGIYMVK